MSMVGDFFIVVGNNVLLGTLVRVGFLRAEFILIQKELVARRWIRILRDDTNSSFEKLASLHSRSQ